MKNKNLYQIFKAKPSTTLAVLFVMMLTILISCQTRSNTQIPQETVKSDTSQIKPTPTIMKAPPTPALKKEYDKSKAGTTIHKKYDSVPPMSIDTKKNYTATIHLDKGGEIVIELYVQEAPITVNNFVFLSNDGFYDGVTFHRVIPDFMAQGGDPTGTGSGSAGYTFDNEFSPQRRHDGPGILSMANAGMRNGHGTNGSQFFITFRETGFLDGLNPDDSEKQCKNAGVSCHTVFGKVIEGMDVVKGITVRDPATATQPGDAIKSISIQEN